MLTDFHPHGKVAQQYGVFNGERGTPIRSVFIVDLEGTLRWKKIYPAGQGLPEIEEILAELDKIQ